MTVEQILQKEISKSKRSLDLQTEGVYIQARSSKKDWTIKLDFTKYEEFWYLYLCAYWN